MKQKNKWITMAKVFLLLLVLVLPWMIPERVQASTEAGSITINLKDLKTPKGDVIFKAYKVGEWNGAEGSWKLLDCLESTGISLNDLMYASEWDAAAMILSTQSELGTLTSVSGKTDENGVMTFGNLELGMYLVVQEGESEYGTVSPFLATLPYTEDGIVKYDMTLQPKAEPPLEDGNGRIVVTKRVGIVDATLLEVVDIILEEDITYYVGIFKDAQGRIPYGIDYIKEIPMKGLSQGSVTFGNLPAGTYYIFETDEDGNAFQLNDVQENEDNSLWTCRLDGCETQEVTIDGKSESPAGTIGFYNQYTYLNGYYSYSGIIYISKQVLDDEGEEITVPETFYAGIFYDKDATELCCVVELEQNEMVSVEVPLGGENGDEEITYYVYETDKEGNLIDKKSFGYTVIGEGKVEIRNGSWEDDIAIINMKKSDDTSIKIEKKDTPEKTNKVRTGDETPIIAYVIMLAAAVFALTVGIIYRRGKKKHE